MKRFLTTAIVALGVTACSRGVQANEIQATVTPVHVIAPVDPAPMFLPLPESQAARYRALASRARPCRVAQIARRIRRTLFIGCDGGSIVAVGTRGEILASAKVPMDGLTSILPAGQREIAVSGFSDGAMMTKEVIILHAKTLKTLPPGLMSDSTFLGVIGNRAYIDDWCCFGRPDEYRPATIYSISLENGSASRSIDLAPDPQAHPTNSQPLGQGEHNYLIGRYFYVVVGRETYRYTILNLAHKPKRMLTPKASP